MAVSAPDLLTEEEIAAILAQPKFIAADLDWNERPNNSNFLAATANILDENGATIPGLTMELAYRRGRIAEDCKYDFSIFSLRGNRKRRVYQINVVAPDRWAHIDGDGTWFGPHQHFGERAARIEPDPGLGCTDHEKWFRLFLKQANIQFSGKYLPAEIQGRLI